MSLNPSLAGRRLLPPLRGAGDGRLPTLAALLELRPRGFYNPKPVPARSPGEPDGRIWLLRRGPSRAPARWSMPGGFVDLGETVEDAARRELREELCVEATIGALLGVYSRAEDRIVLVVFAATLARRAARDRRGARGARRSRPRPALGRAGLLVGRERCARASCWPAETPAVSRAVTVVVPAGRARRSWMAGRASASATPARAASRR